ncbi:MAG: phage tail tape measure protein, partial [Tissierellia bacterium]|nr:phage tail tape measure protein [Tissierellia bacterium]
MKVTECAVISSKTRESSESIGHSINTMLSRLSRITQTGFNEEDDTKLNDVAKALNSIDIALTDSQGNFRNFGTILDEVNSKWSKLDDQTRAYVANTIAGTRQQSRFYNLMNGYAESMELYSQSLESAGTAQSKFNLYLESNQATLDKFRTTMEGLWLSVIDSDSLMDIVKTATTFIETLDTLVQKFGTVGAILNFLIPLMGVKFVWSIRAAYIEMVKLQATGSMSAFMPTSKILGQIIAQMLGLKTAAGGATIAVGGLTLAT